MQRSLAELMSNTRRDSQQTTAEAWDTEVLDRMFAEALQPLALVPPDRALEGNGSIPRGSTDGQLPSSSVLRQFSGASTHASSPTRMGQATPPNWPIAGATNTGALFMRRGSSPSLAGQCSPHKTESSYRTVGPLDREIQRPSPPPNPALLEIPNRATSSPAYPGSAQSTSPFPPLPSYAAITTVHRHGSMTPRTGSPPVPCSRGNVLWTARSLAQARSAGTLTSPRDHRAASTGAPHSPMAYVLTSPRGPPAPRISSVTTIISPRLTKQQAGPMEMRSLKPRLVSTTTTTRTKRSASGAGRGLANVARRFLPSDGQSSQSRAGQRSALPIRA